MSINVDEGIYNTPKLENLWYCPYYIHQREKTWFEKKQTCYNEGPGRTSGPSTERR